ncbi:MAG: dTMP kinase [Holosporales bacterium]|jgi:dTMP kinase|nr:dTMP kinase [Holosporales bacterium]
MVGSSRGSGLFVTFEGGEGCGKTLQARLLFDWIGSLGYTAVLTREPGGTTLSESIRKLVLIGNADKWDPTTEALLYLAARSDHWYKKIKPAIDLGQIVICDRFHDSTTVYQGKCKEVSSVMLANVFSEITNNTYPDRTYLLDIPPQIGIERSMSRDGNDETRFENMDISFHEEVRASYLELAENNPARFMILDGTLSPQPIHEQIQEDFRKLIHSRRFRDEFKH